MAELGLNHGGTVPEPTRLLSCLIIHSMGGGSGCVKTRGVFEVEAQRENSAGTLSFLVKEERNQTLRPTPGVVGRDGGQTLNGISRPLGEVVGSLGPTSWLGREVCSVPGISLHTVDTQLICQPERRKERPEEPEG